MADIEAPAAESSPAAPAATPDATPAAEPISVPKDPEAYAEWRQTGKLPEDGKPSKREDSATSKTSVDDESEKGAPVSETGNKGRNAESRIKQVVSERDTFKSERDSYKARLEALEAGKTDASGKSSPAPAKDANADSSTAPGGLQRPVRPKQENFDSWEAYETASDKYIEDLADFKAAKRLEEHVQRLMYESQTRETQKLLDGAKERYGEAAEPKIIDTAKAILGDKAVAGDLKIAIGRSQVLVDALYVMGSDPEELSGFIDLAKKDPLEALRKWFTIESLVKEELSGTPAKAPNGTPRGPDGKFLPEKPAKRVEAPSPPRELGGNSSPPGDERERAAKTGDFRSFKSDADRRDMQRFKGQ